VFGVTFTFKIFENSKIMPVDQTSKPANQQTGQPIDIA